MGAACTFEFTDPKTLPVPKEHGIYPLLGEQFLALENNAALGNVTVHCPDKECKNYAGYYSTAQLNNLNAIGYPPLAKIPRERSTTVGLRLTFASITRM